MRVGAMGCYMGHVQIEEVDDPNGSLRFFGMSHHPKQECPSLITCPENKFSRWTCNEKKMTEHLYEIYVRCCYIIV